MIGRSGERGSGISVLAARHDDDDDDKIKKSSSCYAARTDFPNSLLPSVSIIHHFQQVFQASFRIRTELLWISSSWSSYTCASV